MTTVSIINKSSKVTDADAQAAVIAFNLQFANDVKPAWGWVPTVDFNGKGIPAYIVDTMPEAPGALGYHAEDTDGSVTGVKGQAYIKVLVADGYDWRTTMSHELLELAMDFAANLWADMPDGSDVARELCDPVENDTYLVDNVPVSNFVYPSWFNPSGKAPYDKLGKLTAPFTMTAGGYMIVRTEPGQTTQVTGQKVPVVKSRGRLLNLVFHPDYPEAKKPGKIYKALRRVA